MKTPPTLTKSLICTLSDEERRNYGIQLATTLEEIEKVETEKKQQTDHFKDRIGGLQANADTIRRKVSSGQEWREVECTVVLGQPTPDHKQIVRNDTGEVVTTECMNNADRQSLLPLDEPESDDGDVIDVEAEPVEEDADERNEVEVEHDLAEGAGDGESEPKKQPAEAVVVDEAEEVPEFLKKKSRKKKADEHAAQAEPMPENDPDAPAEAEDAGDY